MSGCIFCKILNRQKNKARVLTITKNHRESVRGMDAETSKSLLPTQKELIKIISKFKFI